MKKQKTIKAWVFMASEKGKLYFITDSSEKSEIYLKKPKPVRNPFDYFHQNLKWKPTKVLIKIV
jgi:hypothetical protein